MAKNMMKNIGRTALIASALAGVLMTGSGCATGNSRPLTYKEMIDQGYHDGSYKNKVVREPSRNPSGRNMTPIYNEATSGMFIPRRVIVEHRYRKRK